jgi:hypothetical protein
MDVVRVAGDTVTLRPRTRGGLAWMNRLRDLRRRNIDYVFRLGMPRPVKKPKAKAS